jgi:hypothetical protein
MKLWSLYPHPKLQRRGGLEQDKNEEHTESTLLLLLLSQSAAVSKKLNLNKGAWMAQWLCGK